MRSILKWLLRGVLALVVIVGGLVATAYGVAQRALSRDYALPTVALPLRDDAATLARGEYLARTRGCRGCHGADFGGKLAVSAGPVGRFYAPNLTRGGVLADYDVATFEHAVRHGVNRAGHALRVMPSGEYAAMADDDVAALYAFLRSVAAVDTVQPPIELGTLGYVLYLIGKFPMLPAETIDHAAASAPKAMPDQRSSAAIGRYAAQTCTGCHRRDFSGGHVPGTPPSFKDAANLTPHAQGLASWTREDFVRAMREGKRPDGRELDRFMPWQSLGALDDAELNGLWDYLSALPPKPTASPN